MIASKLEINGKQTAALALQASGLEMSSNDAQLDAIRLAAMRRGRGIGVMFLGSFGTWWLAAGARAAFGDSFAMLFAIIAIGTLMFVAGLYYASGKVPKTRDSDYLAEQQRRSKVFRNVNIAQWLVISLLILSLNAFGKGEWAIPAIILVVGIHFFPLAKLFASRANALTGAAMVLIALIYPWLSAQGPNNPGGAIATGIVLWANVLYTLYSVPSRNRTL